MEAYGDEKEEREREKGLFTFYIEQAEIEDELKHQRKIEREKEKERKQKKGMGIAATVKAKEDNGIGRVQGTIAITNGAIPKPGFSEQEKDRMKEKMKQRIECRRRKGSKQGKIQEFQVDGEQHSKIIQILERHKYKNGKNPPLKIVMKETQQPDIVMKQHLSGMLGGKVFKTSQLIDNCPVSPASSASFDSPDGNFRHKHKLSSPFASSQEKPTPVPPVSSNPFQRLALCPTNFDTDFQELPKEEGRGRRLLSKSIDVSLQECRKLENEVSTSRHLEQKERDVSEVVKHFLPKLDFGSGARLVKITKREKEKEKERYQGKGKRRYHGKGMTDRSEMDLKSDRYGTEREKGKSYNSGESLIIQSSSYSMRMKAAKAVRGDNKIYPIFIENKKPAAVEEPTRFKKDRLYMDIIKQLKFK